MEVAEVIPISEQLENARVVADDLYAERTRLRARLERIAAYIRAHVDEPRHERNYVAANVLDIINEDAS